MKPKARQWHLRGFIIRVLYFNVMSIHVWDSSTIICIKSRKMVTSPTLLPNGLKAITWIDYDHVTLSTYHETINSLRTLFWLDSIIKDIQKQNETMISAMLRWFRSRDHKLVHVTLRTNPQITSIYVLRIILLSNIINVGMRLWVNISNGGKKSNGICPVNRQHVCS